MKFFCFLVLVLISLVTCSVPILEDYLPITQNKPTFDALINVFMEEALCSAESKWESPDLRILAMLNAFKSHLAAFFPGAHLTLGVSAKDSSRLIFKNQISFGNAGSLNFDVPIEPHIYHATRDDLFYRYRFILRHAKKFAPLRITIPSLSYFKQDLHLVLNNDSMNLLVWTLFETLRNNKVKIFLDLIDSWWPGGQWTIYFCETNSHTLPIKISGQPFELIAPRQILLQDTKTSKFRLTSHPKRFTLKMAYQQEFVPGYSGSMLLTYTLPEQSTHSNLSPRIKTVKMNVPWVKAISSASERTVRKTFALLNFEDSEVVKACWQSIINKHLLANTKMLHSSIIAHDIMNKLISSVSTPMYVNVSMEIILQRYSRTNNRTAVNECAIL